MYTREINMFSKHTYPHPVNNLRKIEYFMQNCG